MQSAQGIYLSKIIYKLIYFYSRWLDFCRWTCWEGREWRAQPAWKPAKFYKTVLPWKQSTYSISLHARANKLYEKLPEFTPCIQMKKKLNFLTTLQFFFIFNAFLLKTKNSILTCGFAMILSRNWNKERNFKMPPRGYRKEKPTLKCALCSYTSQRQSCFTDHLRVHSGEKPFTCVSERIIRKQWYSKQESRMAYGRADEALSTVLVIFK